MPAATKFAMFDYGASGYDHGVNYGEWLSGGPLVSVLETCRNGLARTGWPVSRVPNRPLGYLIVVEVVAFGAAVVALTSRAGSPVTVDSWFKCGLLICLAIGFEEASTRLARLQLRIAADLKHDMTSVWILAGAVALPLRLALLLSVTILSYTWFRQQRPAGEALYRKLFNSANVVIIVLAANSLARLIERSTGDFPKALGGALVALAAVAVFSLVNRALATGALLLLGVPWRELGGTRDNNLTELATVCLGGLVSVVVVFEPWLVFLAVAPMVALQRGAVVRELETAATTDAKTGLLNAVAWEQVAQRELARAVRQNTRLAVLIIDIDRFKTVNDRFGHLAGDAALRAVGKTLGGSVRDYDTVGRFGGEEFVAVLPTADEADALTVAERMRSLVNALRVSQFVDIAEPNGDELAVSIGVACLPTDGVELPDLLLAADAALYRAKATGRNRVVLAERGTGGQQSVNA